MSGVLIYVAAFILDLVLGDPEHWPHPIRFIGTSIQMVQQYIRARVSSSRALYWGGALMWAIVVGGTWWVTHGLVLLAFHLHFLLGTIVTCWLAYTTLATRCLSDCAYRVYNALQSGSLTDSRKQLSAIVGRDTSELTAPQIMRAVVETVAENTVDGVIAPLFYLFIGGVPLAMAYKAINTLDSMVGYKTAKYREIGFVSAKLDDVANYIPARLSWLFFSLAAWFLRLDSTQALKIGWRDRYHHHSPNCAWAEASVAGALGVRLGGPNTYFGEYVEKPWIGDAVREIEPDDIPRSVKMMFVTAGCALVCFVLTLS